jgi:hypothetical protein
MNLDLMKRRSIVAAYFDALEQLEALKSFDPSKLSDTDPARRGAEHIGFSVAWQWGASLAGYESTRRAIQAEMVQMFDAALQKAIDAATLKVETAFEEALRATCGTDTYANAMRSLFGKKPIKPALSAIDHIHDPLQPTTEA